MGDGVVSSAPTMRRPRLAGLARTMPAERETILRFFMIDRALRELDGELHNRAEWVGIPAGGLLDLLEVR